MFFANQDLNIERKYMKKSPHIVIFLPEKIKKTTSLEVIPREIPFLEHTTDDWQIYKDNLFNFIFN